MQGSEGISIVLLQRYCD